MVTEKPGIEILAEPQWDILEYGDGYIALALGGIITESEEGEKVVDFMIKPSPLLRKRYNIPDSQLNINLCMSYRVCWRDLIPLNMFDAANRKWLYIKNFRHEQTELTRWGWKLRKENEMLSQRIQTLEGENMWLLEQLQLAKTNPQEFIKQGTEILESVGSRFADILRGDKEKQELMK